MNRRDKTIGHLKKVTLALEWDGRKIPYEFIFGIGTGGLSPFEFDLAGKSEGHEGEYHLKRTQLNGLFQHLTPPLFLCDVPDAFTLKVRVVGIGEADQREVIKAMAEASSCGSQCCGH
jgi:hypothetical protein